MKSARERMDIVAAYEQVGTYRGAAALCGTTHKTVKRVIERRRAGEAFDAPGHLRLCFAVSPATLDTATVRLVEHLSRAGSRE